MTFIQPYKKRISAFIQNESFEPMVSWGIRMGVSGTVPILWGLATDRLNDAVWIALTAEGISWVEMKGSFNWRIRTLFIGALLALFWGAIGTISGSILWLSVLLMFVAAFAATLLKNMGDRASGLAICVYLMFIICNAYPDSNIADVAHRIRMIGIGAAWPILVGLSASLLMPVQQPFRRQIALIWRSIASLVETLSVSGLDAKAHQAMYDKEREVRAAIDHSFEFYGKMVHQANGKDKHQYQLLQVRKNAALVAVNVISMAEEMEHIAVGSLEEPLRIKAATLFSALKEAINRTSVYVLTLKVEEKLLAQTQINRVKKLTALIAQYPLPEGAQQTKAINRILQLAGRTVKLMESAIQRIEQMGEDAPVYRTYSWIKTMIVLRPKKVARNLKSLFNFNALSIRYALRSATAAAVAIFIAKYFEINHGYWLPFSLMIVIQPYFGATLQKARDRVVGTLLGGIVGGLLSLLPTGLHIKEAMLFATFVMMVYFVRKKYALATFVVTLNLVLLFNIDQTYNNHLMLVRLLCTVGGCLLAVVSGFVLFPAWDKKWLPAHLADAIATNYYYFINTFYPGTGLRAWTKNKRLAESKNSNVFESFNRYMEEPGSEKHTEYYDLITCNVRITRDMNSINVEHDEHKITQTNASAAQQARIDVCLDLFHEILPLLRGLDPDVAVQTIKQGQRVVPSMGLNEAQMVSLEKLRIELLSMKEDLQEHLGETEAELNMANG